LSRKGAPARIMRSGRCVMLQKGAWAASLVFMLVAIAGRADDAGKAAKRKAAGLVVRGRVTDAASGQPIARVRLIPAPASTSGGRTTWQPHLMKTHEGGRYEFRAPRPWERTRFRVEAEGYRPEISRPVKETEGEVVIDFALHKDPGLSGIVRNVDGAPVAG